MNASKIIRLILLTTVFVTGAAVLIVEVAAVRLLAPYFGASLYVLSSVLTVILCALACGYKIGGYISDKYPFHTPLYVLITLGGCSLLVLTACATYILPNFAAHLSQLFGPLVVSIFLFFTPAFLLGIDSPYVIKLLSKEASPSTTGKTVGTTFFWSTAGSITGSISSGFILIPTFGLLTTLITTSLVLIVLGIGGGLLLLIQLRTEVFYDKRNELAISNMFLLFCLAIVCSCGYLFYTVSKAEANILYQDDGFYSHISVYDGMYNGKIARFLRQDSNSSSAIYLDSDDLVYPYVQYSLFYKYLIPKPNTFLMLASGAYTIPRAIHLNEPDTDIDVVDIEPGLYDLAVTYFKLPTTTKITDHVIDARVYIQTNEKKYDYIFIDVFNSGQFVPEHLITQEFFIALKKDLAPEAIVIMNFIGTQPDLPSGRTLSGSFTKTVESIFPNFRVFSSRNQNIHTQQNFIFILRNGMAPLVIPKDATITVQGKAIPASSLEIDKTKIIHTEDIIFTDNYVPSDTLLFKERF